ncbi:MAG: T9SS type A sorting domain-containing protein [candidate division WOR-3 bacterium]
MSKLKTLLLIVICGLNFAQTQRWVYRYNGPGNYEDWASSLVYGQDGNIYAAGVSGGDFTVISLTTSGTERWVYRFNGPGDDRAFSLVYGADGNIYVAGYTFETSSDFTVISLTPSGTERWIYRYNGPGSSSDMAFSLVYGGDGNIYAAGFSSSVSGHWDFTVISLTTSGTQRWVSRYNGPGSYLDYANSIVYGEDGNIYAGGVSFGYGTDRDFTVISLTPSGTERWVYRYNGPGNGWDEVFSIGYGQDGNIYAAGRTDGSGTSTDFTVISLTTSGTERWVYRYNGLGNSEDCATSLVYGADGNIYAAGISYGPISDFTVISLTTSGTQRWVYRYSGSDYPDRANSIVYGQDGNIYAAGVSGGDFTVISLTTSGTERWVYCYNGLGNGNDEASSLVYGPDGNIYAAGLSERSNNNPDFIVISIRTAPVPFDVGCTKIIAPAGTITEGSVITPACSVYNYGTTSVNYFVRMKIGTSYNYTAAVNNHLPCSLRYVTFPEWIASELGNLVVTCSTELSNDMNNMNDKQEGEVLVQPCFRDVGVISILSPIGTIPPGSYIPKARVKNYGDNQETFPVYFRIISGSDTIYTDYRNITLNSGQEDTIEFNSWSANEGSYTTYCRTALNGDENLANDIYTGSCLVQTIRDVGVVSVIFPIGTISPGPAVPQARVKNYGNVNASFNVCFSIFQAGSEVYADDTVIPTLLPDSSLNIDFREWTAEVGFYTAKCSTYLPSDVNSENDTGSVNFLVQPFDHDVGVVQIITPIGVIPPGSYIPKVRVKNYGNYPENFPVCFKIIAGSDTVYADEKSVDLNSGQEDTVEFDIWNATEGFYTTYCRTALHNDENPNNDKRFGSVRVEPQTYGWQLVGHIPLEPDRKRIKSGGGMTVCGSSLYILKGNNTKSLYRYTPNTVWAVFEDSVPLGTSGKKVKRGSGITSDGRYLYIFKGANTLEFFRYDPQRGETTWLRLEDAPLQGGKMLRNGTSVCYLSGYIYLLKGSNTNEFHRFNLLNQRWESSLAPPPRTKGFKAGSCLVAYNDQIYLLGNNYNNFYCYSPSTNRWDTLRSMPLYHPQLNRKKKVKEGAALAVKGNKIFAFKGGNTCEFWMYYPAKDSWYPKDTIPRGEERKRVKGGGSLVGFGVDIYALKGNNTTSIWKYAEEDLPLAVNLPNIATMEYMTGKETGIQIVSNPTRGLTNVYYHLSKKELATLKIYNTLGNLVYSAKSNKGEFTIKKLPAGIYLLRFESASGGYKEDRKLIVVK